MTRFEDRTDAGTRLARELTERGVYPDVVVAIPRGGVPVGRAVADAFDRPLAVVVVEKIRIPALSELVVGRVTADGAEWVDRSLVRVRGISPERLAEARETAMEAARARDTRYGAAALLDLRGRVVVVDDTAATGATAAACLRYASRLADQVTFAVPVAVRRALERLRSEADELVCVHLSDPLEPLESHYREFDPVDELG